MKKHIEEHFQQGCEHWGVFEVNRLNASIGQIAEMLYIYWSVDQAEDIKNGIQYIT